MKTILGTQNLIENLVQATYGDNVPLRQKHIFKETLQALVRLAKAEQMLEMRRDVEKSVSNGTVDTCQAYWKVQ